MCSFRHNLPSDIDWHIFTLSDIFWHNILTHNDKYWRKLRGAGGGGAVQAYNFGKFDFEIWVKGEGQDTFRNFKDAHYVAHARSRSKNLHLRRYSFVIIVIIRFVLIKKTSNFENRMKNLAALNKTNKNYARSFGLAGVIFPAELNLSHLLCCMLKSRSTFWDVLFLKVARVMNRKHFPNFFHYWSCSYFILHGEC